MPAYSPKNTYTLTSTQVDLILYCLEFTSNLTIDEDNERRKIVDQLNTCLLYTSPSPRDRTRSRMPSSA